MLSTKIYSYKKEINQLGILNKEKRISQIFTELNLYNKKKGERKTRINGDSKILTMLSTLYGESTKVNGFEKKPERRSKGNLLLSCRNFYGQFPFRLFCKFWFFTNSVKKKIKKINSNKVKARIPVFGSSAHIFKLDVLKCLLKNKSLKPVLKEQSFTSFKKNLFVYLLYSLIRFNEYSTLSRNNNLISVNGFRTKPLPDKKKTKEPTKTKKGLNAFKTKLRKKNSLNVLNVSYSKLSELGGFDKKPVFGSSRMLKKTTYFSSNDDSINLNFNPNYRIPKELLDCTIKFPAKKNYVPIHVTINKVGYKLGEFFPTRTNVKFNQLYKGKPKEQRKAYKKKKN